MLDWLVYFATGFPLFWGVGVSLFLIVTLVVMERTTRNLPDAPPPRPRGTSIDFPYGIPRVEPTPPTRCVVVERHRS